MKKVILAITAFTIILTPVAASAIDLGGGFADRAAERAGYDPNTSDTTLASTIGQVIKIALSFIGIFFTVLMVYAGFLWMAARGEESQIEKSKKIITAAIIGIVLTLASYSITNFVVPRVLDLTTGNSLGNDVGGEEPQE